MEYIDMISEYSQEVVEALVSYLGNDTPIMSRDNSLMYEISIFHFCECEGLDIDKLIDNIEGLMYDEVIENLENNTLAISDATIRAVKPTLA